MQKLLEILASIVAFVAGLKTTNTKLAEELKAANTKIEEQATTIETLQKQVAEDAINDAELEQAATDARQAAKESADKLAALQAEVDGAVAKGEEIAALINEHPETLNVDPVTFQPV